jgi:hypothetical protein
LLVALRTCRKRLVDLLGARRARELLVAKLDWVVRVRAASLADMDCWFWRSRFEAVWRTRRLEKAMARVVIG